MDMNPEKIERAKTALAMAVEKRNFSVSYLEKIKKLCQDCNFSEDNISKIDAMIKKTERFSDDCHAKIKKLVEKGLKENSPVICKKCCLQNSPGCKTVVSRILKDTIAIFCTIDKVQGIDKPQETLVRPNKISFLKTAKL